MRHHQFSRRTYCCRWSKENIQREHFRWTFESGLSSCWRKHAIVRLSDLAENVFLKRFARSQTKGKCRDFPSICLWLFTISLFAARFSRDTRIKKKQSHKFRIVCNLFRGNAQTAVFSFIASMQILFFIFIRFNKRVKWLSFIVLVTIQQSLSTGDSCNFSISIRHKNRSLVLPSTFFSPCMEKNCF